MQQSDAAGKTGDDTPPVALMAVPSLSLPPGAPAMPPRFARWRAASWARRRSCRPSRSAPPCRIDGRSDLYSLGVVAYYLLVGHPPFRGSTNMDVMAARSAMRPRHGQRRGSHSRRPGSADPAAAWPKSPDRPGSATDLRSRACRLPERGTLERRQCRRLVEKPRSRGRKASRL